MTIPISKQGSTTRAGETIPTHFSSKRWKTLHDGLCP